MLTGGQPFCTPTLVGQNALAIRSCVCLGSVAHVSAAWLGSQPHHCRPTKPSPVSLARLRCHCKEQSQEKEGISNKLTKLDFQFSNLSKIPDLRQLCELIKQQANLHLSQFPFPFLEPQKGSGAPRHGE